MTFLSARDACRSAALSNSSDAAWSSRPPTKRTGFPFSTRVLVCNRHKRRPEFRSAVNIRPKCCALSPYMLGSDFLTNYFMRRVYFSSDSDDLALVRQSLAGQTEAFGALVTRYQRVMYTVALRMLGNAEDAQDATQDAFIKAYQRLASFDPSYRFYSWMYRILVNECLNVNRDRRPDDPLDDDAAGGGTPFDDA